MVRLRSFAQWLAGHAGLVSSLTFQSVLPRFFYPPVDGLPYDAHMAAAQELLQLSLHAAGATQAAGDSTHSAAPEPAAAAAAAVTVKTAAGASQQQQQQQQQQGLPVRLRSFSSCWPKAVDMLAVLHGQHLTSVRLCCYRAMSDSSALSLALARLSNLQQLRLGDLWVRKGSIHRSLGWIMYLRQLMLL
jgi:hypothetical protein